MSIEFILFVVLIIVIVFFLYFIFRKAKNADVERVKSVVKFYGIFILVIIVLLLLIYHVIEIYVYFGADYEANMLFTLFNSAIFGVYWCVVGIFNKGIQNNVLRVIIMIVILYLFLSGFGFIDFHFKFNIPFVFHTEYNVYATSNAITAYFMLYNLPLFIGIIVLSFLIAKKKE